MSKRTATLHGMTAASHNNTPPLRAATTELSHVLYNCPRIALLTYSALTPHTDTNHTILSESSYHVEPVGNSQWPHIDIRLLKNSEWSRLFYLSLEFFIDIILPIAL